MPKSGTIGWSPDDHSTDHANMHMKDRHSPSDAADPAFKMVEVLGKLEATSANLRTSMDRIVTVLQQKVGTGAAGGGLYGQGGHGGLFGLAHQALFWGHFARRGHQAADNFFREFFITGRRISHDFWIADGHFRGQAAGVGRRFGERLTDRARPVVAGALTLADFGLNAASPETASTLEKSFKLFQARAEAGLIGPAAKLAFKMQDGANWFQRQPDWVTKTVGWTVGLTAAGGASVLAVGAFARAVTACAQAAALASRTFAGTAVANRAVAATQAATAATAAGGSAAGAATTRAVATAGVTTAVGRAAGLGSRLSGAAGRIPGVGFLGPLAGVIGAAVDSYNLHRELTGDTWMSEGMPHLAKRFNPAAGFGLDNGQDIGTGLAGRLARWKYGEKEGNARAAEVQKYITNVPNYIKYQFGLSDKPFRDDLFKDTPADPDRKARGPIVSPRYPKGPPPAIFENMEDVRHAITLSALTPVDPLDQAIDQAQQDNYARLLEAQMEANGYLKQIADKPDTLTARP